MTRRHRLSFALAAVCGLEGISIHNGGEANTGDAALATLRSLITDIDC